MFFVNAQPDSRHADFLLYSLPTVFLGLAAGKWRPFPAIASNPVDKVSIPRSFPAGPAALRASSLVDQIPSAGSPQHEQSSRGLPFSQSALECRLPAAWGNESRTRAR